jgi:DNA-binding PadR family transcriptional regulator
MTIRSALLQLLDEGERHGYQLKVDFEARTGGIWPLNVGQVYTTLDRLQRDGLVVATDPPDEASQRRYTITDDGRAEVKRWLAASAVDTNPPRDELIMKVLLAIGRGHDEAIALIDEQRSALLAALQLGRRRQRAEPDGGGPSKRLARDAVLTRVEADLTWLDRCEDLIRTETKANGRTS